MLVKVALIAAALVLGVVIGHNGNVYDGLNTGATWGSSLGCEVVGLPDCWVGQFD